MLHFFYLLFSTVAYRPYVFVFFACYLFLAVTHIGWKRTALFSVLAFLVAFVCEWSSAVAATGFPFGLYYYINETSDKELWIAGVPFMDSLSFTFLSYVSWELATMLTGRLQASWRDVQVLNREQASRSWATALLAPFLMMYLDIIIDPVALRGDRWFLGKIYFYPDGGSYFGITLANFLGWYFVCFVILRLFVWLETLVFAHKSVPGSGRDRVSGWCATLSLQSAGSDGALLWHSGLQPVHDVLDWRTNAGRCRRDYRFTAGCDDPADAGQSRTRSFRRRLEKRQINSAILPFRRSNPLSFARTPLEYRPTGSRQ